MLEQHPGPHPQRPLHATGRSGVSRASTSARSETSAASSVRPSSPRAEHLGEQQRHGGSTVAGAQGGARGRACSRAARRRVARRPPATTRSRSSARRGPPARRRSRPAPTCHGRGRLATRPRRRARRTGDPSASIAAAAAPTSPSATPGAASGPRRQLVVLATLVGRDGECRRDLGGQRPVTDGSSTARTSRRRRPRGGRAAAPPTRRPGRSRTRCPADALAEQQTLLGDRQGLVEPTRLHEHLREVGERRQLGRVAPHASRPASSRPRSTGRAPRTSRGRLPQDAPQLPRRRVAATWARCRARLGSGAPRELQGRGGPRMRSPAVRRPAGSRRPPCGSPGAGRRAARAPARAHQPASQELVDRRQGRPARSSSAVTRGEVEVERVAQHRTRRGPARARPHRGRPARRTRPRRCRSVRRRRSASRQLLQQQGVAARARRRSGPGPPRSGRARSAGRPRTGRVALRSSRRE